MKLKSFLCVLICGTFMNASYASKYDVVNSYYQTYLGRTPAAREVKGWLATNQSVGSIRTQIIWSKESSTIIDSLYRRILNRVPESAAAVQSWQQSEQNGSSLPNVIYSIAYSNEAAIKITAFYRTALKRNPTGPEVNYYRGLLYAGWSLIQVKGSIDSLK